jgi:ABC-type multidrug transport system fused ATPase/permease subunit
LLLSRIVGKTQSSRGSSGNDPGCGQKRYLCDCFQFNRDGMVLSQSTEITGGLLMPDQRVHIQSMRFDQVTIKFPDHEPILNRCDFEFPMQEILWIKSSEGAGKSSLLQIVAGLENPNGGRFWINQLDVTEMSFEEFLPIRLNIGYSFDYGGLISNRSLYDNLMLPLVYHHLIPPSEAKSRVLNIFKNSTFQKWPKKDQLMFLGEFVNSPVFCVRLSLSLSYY